MEWERVGRILRRVDPDRFRRLLNMASTVVDVHLGLGLSGDDAVPIPVDLEASTDVC